MESDSLKRLWLRPKYCLYTYPLLFFFEAALGTSDTKMAILPFMQQGAFMPFYRVQLNSGKSDILYAHSEDHAKAIAIRKHGPNPSDQGEEVLNVEYIKREDDEC